MKNAIIVGAIGALCTGLAIGAQSSLSNRTGSLIGPTNTGLLTNLVGGIIAGLIVLVISVRQGIDSWSLSRTPITLLVAAGALGVFIVTGVAFSLSRIGVVAGSGTIIMGQMLVSTVADAIGWGGMEPIPLSPRRIVGLLVMAAAVYLLLPDGG